MSCILGGEKVRDCIEIMRKKSFEEKHIRFLVVILKE